VPIFHDRQAGSPSSVIAQGTAPSTVGFVDGKDSVALPPRAPTQWFTMIPTIYNADTLGIRPDLVGRPITQWKDHPGTPKFQGQDLDPEHPLDRHHGCRDDSAESAGIAKYAEQGQHDQGPRSTRRSTS